MCLIPKPSNFSRQCLEPTPAYALHHLSTWYTHLLIHI